MLRWIALILCLSHAIAPTIAAAAPYSSIDEEAAPGPTGAASFGGVQQIFARRGDGAVWVRQTDGLWYSGWSPLGGYTDDAPAAASTDRLLVVFLRDAAGQVWSRRSLDGHSYDPWSPVGATSNAAPAAVGAGGTIYLFTLDGAGMLAVRTSADGLTFGAPLALGGPLAAAPVAVAEGDHPVVIGIGHDGQSYRLAGGATWGNWHRLGGAEVPQYPLADAPDLATPPLTLDLGVNFISEQNWTSYQLPAYARLRPGLAKFTMFYDAYPYTPVFSAAAIDDAIARGARTVIFRTAETRIAPEVIERELHLPLPGGDRSLLDYIGAHAARDSGVEFWIEVGNEPDLAGVNPLLARYALLGAVREIAPRYRASHPNLRWMASLPTRAGLRDSPLPTFRSLSYLDLVLADFGDGLGAVASQYDALGVHIYGADTLQQSFPALHAPSDRFDCGKSNGDAFCPLAVLDRVLARTDRPIFITEAGIDSAMPWSLKAKFYVEALQRLPSRVRGVALFTLSLDPEWYAGSGGRCTKLDLAPCSRYAIDVNEAGVLDPNFAGATGIGQCYRRASGQSSEASGCGLPCTANDNAPPLPRSAAQRASCQVSADHPAPSNNPLAPPGSSPSSRSAAIWRRIAP